MAHDDAERRRAQIALALIVPVPSLGTTAAMIVFPGPMGQSLFMAAKIWLLAFPAFWYLVVERGKPSWSPASDGGLGVGLLTGLVEPMLWVMLIGNWYTVGQRFWSTYRTIDQ